MADGDLHDQIADTQHISSYQQAHSSIDFLLKVIRAGDRAGILSMVVHRRIAGASWCIQHSGTRRRQIF
jgi:hypothetical protein